MKNLKSIVLLATGLMCMSAGASAQDVETSFNFKPRNVMTASPKINLLTENADSKYIPGTRTEYVWNGVEWVKKTERVDQYNDGIMLSSKFYNYSQDTLTSCYFWTYAYDQQGRMTDEFCRRTYGSNADWEDYRMMHFEYDEVVPDYVVFTEDLWWNKGSETWDDRGVKGSTIYKEVRRNADDNVVICQAWRNKNMANALLGFKFAYNDQGMADRMCMRFGSEATGMPENLYLYDNIEWEKTNGQYLKLTSKVYYTFNNDPENIVKSFTLYKVNNNDVNDVTKMADVKNVKSGDSRFYNIYFDNYIITSETVDDAANNTVYNYFYYWKDANNSGFYDDGEAVNPSKANKAVTVNDENGNLLSYETYKYDAAAGNLVMDKKLVKDYMYNGLGELEEIISTYYDGTGKITKKTKVIYSDFMEVTTGVRDAAAAAKLNVHDGFVTVAAGTDYIVSDVLGRVVKTGSADNGIIVVSDMPEGMYIVRAGAEAAKVIVR